MVPIDRKQDVPVLDAARLEDRILMSATPLLSVMPLGDSASDISEERIVFAPLGGGEGGGPDSDTTAPTSLGFTNLIDGEDGNDLSINLADHFTDDTDPALSYLILENSNPALFAQISQTGFGGSTLVLDYANDAEGEATLTVRAIDDAGNFADDEMRVTLLPVNDRPTAMGLQDISVAEDGPATVIDLFVTFDDVEDADNELTYEITQNSNPDLFSSIVIDQTAGTLTFNYAANAHGAAEITIRATDTEGLYVEMAAGHGFAIHEYMLGVPGVNHPDLNYDDFALWTHWYFFEYVDGQYNFENVREAHLRTQLQNHPAGIPIILDIEQELFNNTPEGRDRFAEIFDIIRDERPDIDFGLYSIMPEDTWFPPVHAQWAMDDSARGIRSYYSSNYDRFISEYDAWLDRNALFRTEPVSAQFGGQPLSEMVGFSSPSLYTPYRNSSTAYGTLHTDLEIDVNNSSFSLSDNYVADDYKVRIKRPPGTTLPDGLREASTSYYVVNATSTSFQLSETVGGTPIELSGTTSGPVYLELFGGKRYYGHDGAVHYWPVYAEEIIAEAREINDEVIPWLSPSYRAVGVEHIDKNFFRMQLDTVFELADGVALYNPNTSLATYENNPGWWEALTEFYTYINTPTQFTITVNPINDAPTTVGIPDLVLPAGTSGGFLDLHDFFSDPEDVDQLTYQISNVSIPEAFDLISLSDSILELDFADGRTGISFVTVQATDSGGLFVEDTFMVQIGEMGMPEPEPPREGAAPLSWLPPGNNNAEPLSDGWVVMDLDSGESYSTSDASQLASLTERVTWDVETALPTLQAQWWHLIDRNNRKNESDSIDSEDEATTLIDQFIAIPIATIVLP